MVNMMQAVVQNILCNWGLTDYACGTVTAAAPLQVQIHERLVLGEEHLIFTVGSGEYRLISDPGVETGFRLQLQQSFTPGERLILLRVLRGQKFIVLSKVVA